MKKAYIQLGEMFVEVEVLEHKTSYGHDRCVVSPVKGKGKTVVKAERVVDSSKVIIK